MSIGNISGIFYLSLIVLDYLLLMLLIIFSSNKRHKKEKDFNYEKYKRFIIEDKNKREGAN